MGTNSYGDLKQEMEHLTCFAGGMLALGHSTKASTDQKAIEVAKGVTETCYLMYSKQSK